MRVRFEGVRGALAVMVAAGCLALGPANAADPVQVDDAKLQSFVMAAQGVHEVIKSSADRINQVETEDEINQLRQEIDTKVEAVIEQTDGITLAEYKQIHEAARTDPALEDRIIEKFNASGAH